MKIACGTVLFRKYPIEIALDAIKQIGFEYVETQSVGPWCPHVDIEKDDPIRYSDLVKSYGFKGTTALWMRYGTIISSDRCVDWAVRTLEWANAANIPVVNTGDGFKTPEMSDDDALKLFDARIAKILEACEKYQTYIAIEPHGSFSLTRNGIVRLMKASDSKWLGVNYDACNIHRAGYVESRGDTSLEIKFANKDDELSVLKHIVDRVVHVHAKDYSNGKCVPLGEGNVKIAGCLRILKDADYRGAVSLETEGDESFEVSVELARKGYSFLQDALE